jgi:hypothetical protein
MSQRNEKRDRISCFLSFVSLQGFNIQIYEGLELDNGNISLNYPFDLCSPQLLFPSKLLYLTRHTFFPSLIAFSFHLESGCDGPFHFDLFPLPFLIKNLLSMV